ncbi:LytR cell envelope-related transcriptional attenuator [Tamaricihabitans halophyticus]|uniref:LytR cell envelope-related transcriptional attenuator n=1 Tax=Tamaricihabitans halophyticus TaxID=1262583 RepID=A0A4R2R3Z4_9PSEU|nr:LytR C-terminal domain-containing protein [Tamaricihabitans halophyticus]TCP56604.1 LytR cell envelope-related transcriptional attenuator [Tamaricihabitans halophyticus]
MTDPSALSRPARAAGLVLLGIAGLALVIGGVTALTSGDDSEDAAAPTNQPPAATAPPSATESDGPKPTAPSENESARPSPSESRPNGQGNGGNGGQDDGDESDGSAADQQAGNGGDGQRAHSDVPLRVYNNSTIRGLADNAASDFRGAGWNVTQVGNYGSGTIPESTAYFRPGTSEEAAAKQLAFNFGLRAEPRFDGIKDSGSGVIVIVTSNYEGEK